jgi:carboxylesterase
VKETPMDQPQDGNSFTLPGGSTGVLLLHGFTATTFEVRALAERLNAAGYTVSAPLLPGHGTHPDDLNHVKWQDWVQTAETALTDLIKTCRTVYVGGESMGGLLALDLAERLPGIHGLLLYAPAMINRKLILSPLLKHFVKFTGKRNPDDIYEWQGYQVNPVAGAAELYALQRHTTRRLKNVTAPTIIFQGRADFTVSPSGAELLYNRISSPEKELVWYECGHCVLLENDFEDAARQSLAFIKRNLGGI